MSTFQRLQGVVEAFVDALIALIDPPTTPAVATVVKKFFGMMPVDRPFSSDENISMSPAMVETPMLSVTIEGISGEHVVTVPLAVYEKTAPGDTIEVRHRPSRLDEHDTRVSFA
jgi:hypothetical protein